MKCYSAIISNELINHAKTMMNLTYMLLNETSPSEKATFCTFPLVWHSEKSKTIQMIKRLVFDRYFNR